MKLRKRSIPDTFFTQQVNEVKQERFEETTESSKTFNSTYAGYSKRSLRTKSVNSSFTANSVERLIYRNDVKDIKNKKSTSRISNHQHKAKDEYTQKILNKNHLKKIEKKMKERQTSHFKDIEMIRRSKAGTVTSQARRGRKINTHEKASVSLKPSKLKLNETQKKTLSRHMRVMRKVLKDSGDGSSFEDMVDFSKAYGEDNTSLLVFHSLRKALENKKIRTFQDVYIRSECYNEFVEEHEKTEGEKQKQSKNNHKKIPLQSSLKKYRKTNKSLKETEKLKKKN